MKFSPELHFETKQFNDLLPYEIFEILKLRSTVFVEEQKCVYLDPDDSDYTSHHFIARTANEQIKAYCRVYHDECWHIGRIATHPDVRGQGIASQLVKNAINFCKSHDSALSIEMSAQVYLTDFYKRLGFSIQESIYLEDGIPHVRMRFHE